MIKNWSTLNDLFSHAPTHHSPDLAPSSSLASSFRSSQETKKSTIKDAMAAIKMESEEHSDTQDAHHHAPDDVCYHIHDLEMELGQDTKTAIENGHGKRRHH
eukprot:3014100-Rhodomonas_salina.1